MAAGAQPLVEGVIVPIVYADGVASVEFNGPNVRVTLFENRTIAGELVKMPVMEIIGPVEALPEAVLALSEAMAKRPAPDIVLPN